MKKPFHSHSFWRSPYYAIILDGDNRHHMEFEFGANESETEFKERVEEKVNELNSAEV